MKNKCPWCGSSNVSVYLELKDYFLTQEDFLIEECDDCKLLFTVPCPPPSQIGRYYKSNDYLSHNVTKKGLLPSIYNAVKRLNIENKFDMIDHCRAVSKDILDIGCGVGDFLSHAKNNGYNVMGVEPDSDARMIAEKKLGVGVLHPDELRNLPDESVDVITMWHVLEHVSDLKTEISHLSRLLRSNGQLILALPNYKSYDAVYYKDKWAAYDVPRHINHFSRVSIKNIFEKTCFKLIDVKPLKWDSFYISMLSEKYAKNRNFFIKGIVMGCKSNIKAIKTGEFSSLVYIFNKE